MPFGALSPEGRVSLLGATPETVDRMRARNRLEGCYAVKCCGGSITFGVFAVFDCCRQ